MKNSLARRSGGNTYSPPVTIVLPTFNGARYLRESLDSVVAQTHRDWELIVVDDASTDETPELIAAYAALDPRIRPIRNEKNLKLPASLNKGFEQARGTYFTWTSDDNAYAPEALASMMGFLADHSEVDVVYTDYTVIDHAGHEVARVAAGEPASLAEWNYVGPSFMYRRTLHLRLNGYAEDLYLAEDYDFWLRAYCSGELRVLHKDLYRYRRHNTSLTATRSREILMATKQALERHAPAVARKSRRVGARAFLTLATVAEAVPDVRLHRQATMAALMRDPFLVLKSARLYALRALIGWPNANAVHATFRRVRGR